MARVSWVRKAPSGRWQARWRDLQGIEHVKTFPRKTDAEGFLATVETQKRAGTYIDPHLAEQPFGPYLEAFLAGAHQLRPSTRALYEGESRRYLLPAFDRTPIGAIRPEAIRAFMGELLDRGVGVSTVEVVHRILSRVLRQAVADGLLAGNAASLAQPPRTERGAIRILTPDELGALADVVDPRYRAMILLAGYAGLRFGEAAGLRIPRLRLLERKIDIVEGLIEVGGELHFGPLKTSESRRTITIPAFLADELAAHVGAWPDPSGSDLVFTAAAGGPIRRTNWRRRVWAPAVATAGIEPTPTFHHLRHTAAAIAIAEGAHPRAIQTRLGHASITTTLGIYGGLFPSLDEELAERLDASYRDAAARRSQGSEVASDVVARDARAARVRHAGAGDVIPIERAGA